MKQKQITTSQAKRKRMKVTEKKKNRKSVRTRKKKLLNIYQQHGIFSNAHNTQRNADTEEEYG